MGQKLIFCLVLLFVTKLCFANMASPIREGTKSATALSSKDIDILKEKLTVTINKEFSTADYFAEYFINSDFDGKQIPLLFFAKNYKDDFKIWVDDVEINVQIIPQDYLGYSDSTFNGFSNYFEPSSDINDRKIVKIHFERNSAREYVLSDLKYFEIDLEKGEHIIRVKYTATVWKDRSDWVNKYSFPYSLSPASHWRSFGGLEVVINSNEFDKSYTTNLGQPLSGDFKSSTIWEFNKLPEFEVFKINYTPEISSFTKSMIFIEPFGLACIAGIILMIFHFVFVRAYRISNPEKKFSWVMLAGSIVIPFIIILSFIFSYELIDSLIGTDAGKYHGYTFLSFAFYPVILIIYFILMLITDSIIKKNQLKKI